MCARPGCIAPLVLASLCCARPPGEIPPRLVDCPRGFTRLVLDAGQKPQRVERDTNGDGRVDRIFYFEGDQLQRAALDIDYDGATDFVVRYDGSDVPVSWQLPGTSAGTDALPQPAAKPLEQAPPELARLLPSLEPPAPPDCLKRPEVSSYLVDLRSRMYERWNPDLREPAQRVVLSFSLAASGELIGACLQSPGNHTLGASAVRALFRSAPFAPMSERGRCLANRRLVGTFSVQ